MNNKLLFCINIINDIRNNKTNTLSINKRRPNTMSINKTRTNIVLNYKTRVNAMLINKTRPDTSSINKTKIDATTINKTRTDIVTINKTRINNLSINKRSTNTLLTFLNNKPKVLTSFMNETTMQMIEKIAKKEASLSKIDLSKIDNNWVIGITITNSIPYFSNELASKRPRARTVLNYIKTVCHNYPEKINCKLAIAIGDHADNCKEGLMVFSKNKASNCILIPDLYSMGNYSGKINKKDNIPFSKKINESLFIGSTTGNINPENNPRLKLCNFSLNNNNIKGYINNICQIPEEKIAKTYPKYKNFIHGALSIEDQIKYKYLINVDGNTCAWDRLVWILNTNSICLKQKSDNKCWYYDLLENNKHFIEYNEPNEINAIMNKLSQEKCDDIIKNANFFVNEYLREKSHSLYMGHLLYNLSLAK
jgi:hypothetical protein